MDLKEKYGGVFAKLDLSESGDSIWITPHAGEKHAEAPILDVFSENENLESITLQWAQVTAAIKASLINMPKRIRLTRTAD